MSFDQGMAYVGQQGLWGCLCGADKSLKVHVTTPVRLLVTDQVTVSEPFSQSRVRGNVEIRGLMVVGCAMDQVLACVFTFVV